MNSFLLVLSWDGGSIKQQGRTFSSAIYRSDARSISGESLLLFSRWLFEIAIAPTDQEKTTFTCPYGTFAF
ncbi:Retrovirus-related Pol polyprotein from transposon 17.6 [Gossypium australe]|uniref:Retrovirus-related Pol polyprotein from transposon 17.6 n=1 Tax=Gossypium australe TaxID=47621 RepID=A0A5B6WJ19_9ROSI|nr:Retrovirus-related Pol polyprotein from transposon 17.6 [Gossypium australe]